MKRKRGSEYYANLPKQDVATYRNEGLVGSGAVVGPYRFEQPLLYAGSLAAIHGSRRRLLAEAWNNTCFHDVLSCFTLI